MVAPDWITRLLGPGYGLEVVGATLGVPWQSVAVVDGADISTERQRDRHQATYVVLAASVASFALLQGLVIPVLPTIQVGLHTSQNTVTWVLTAYLLAASVFTPIIGRLGDIFGKERLLVAALAALALGSLLAALAGSITVMLPARIIQGIGGGVLPLSFGLIRDEFPAEQVPGAVGVIAALGAAGAGVGIVLAGPIVHLFGYHGLFWIPMVVVSASAVAAYLFIPESEVRTPGRVNWRAAVVLAGWLVALILGISEAPTWGWLSAKVIGLLAAAIILLAAWVWVESRSSDPLVDMRMMWSPAVRTTNFVAFLLGVGMYAVLAFLPQFLQAPTSTGYGFGVSVTQSGLILLPSSLFTFALGLSSGRLSKRYGSKAVLVAGLIISIVTFGLLALAHAAEWEILLAMVIQGVGFGMAFASISALVVEAVPPAQTGVANGMNANIRTIGGCLGVAVMSSIVNSSTHGGLPREAGYTRSFVVLTVAAGAAALAAAFVPTTARLGPPLEDARPSPADFGGVVAGTVAAAGSE
jgi:EmrB/QacA subfamily drug resistance transporter